MKRKKSIIVLDVIALIISVLAISIAYAAISKNSDLIKERCEEINVHFENLSNPTIIGKAQALGRPKIKYNGVLITNINALLKEPGDEVRYKVDIVNTNNFDARISYIIDPNLTEEDKKMLDFKVVYTKDKKSVKVGDILKKHEHKNVTIILSYKDIEDENLLSKEASKMNLSYSITYIKNIKGKSCRH